MSDRIIVMRDGKSSKHGTPLEIYRRPRTRFVADFIGAANILEGRLMTAEGSNATVKVGRGAGACARVADASSAPQVGVNAKSPRRGRIVYPRLRRQETPGLVNQWPATVRRQVLLGDIVTYIVNWPGGEFHVQSFPARPIRRG